MPVKQVVFFKVEYLVLVIISFYLIVSLVLKLKSVKY